MMISSQIEIRTMRARRNRSHGLRLPQKRSHPPQIRLVQNPW